MSYKYKMMFFIIFVSIILSVYAQSNYEEIYSQAISEINEENYGLGIELLRSIQDAEDYMVFYYLGYCYYILENDEQAQIYLSKSIELNNNFVSSHGYLGMSYYFSNKLYDAEQMFLRCIELNGKNYSDYFFLGKIYEQLKESDKAMDYYFEALQIDASDFQTNYAVANIYFDNDDYNNAKKYFEICDMINNQLYPVVNCLIRIKYRENDFKNIEDLKQRLRTIKQNTDNEMIKSLSRFTIDTFTYNDLKIIVDEAFDFSGVLYYHWVFRIYDGDDNFIKSVNLESSLGLRELGTAYIVGIDRYEENRRIHHTTNVGFTVLPDYNIMKNIVIEEIESGLDYSITGIYPFNN